MARSSSCARRSTIACARARCVCLCQTIGSLESRVESLESRHNLFSDSRLQTLDSRLSFVMRTLIHLSDLHFGRLDERVIGPLVTQIAELRPDVVAVSGDLTQRARAHQFKAARAFLDALPRVPQIVVPGNHDVPLYNVFARFARPLDKYRRYIAADTEPFYADAEVAVLGINTARSLTIKYGRVNRRQIARIRERLCPAGDETTKIVVTHHPFDVPAGRDERDLVGRAELAMEALAACGADVLLAGHLHISHTGHTAKRYRIRGHSALVVQAGTA